MALEGLNKTVNNLNKQLGKIKRASAQGLADVGMDLAGKSARKAPIEFGDLRGGFQVFCGQALIAKSDEDGMISLLGNIPTGADAVVVSNDKPYSVIQHERLDFEHPLGGQAKYLEQPLKENIVQYVNHIAKKTREVNK